MTPFSLNSFMVCCLGAVCAVQAQAQLDTASARLLPQQETLEGFLEQVETESDNSEILDRLLWLQEHPFDLNAVSKEELASIPQLTQTEVNGIIALRKKLKKFSSVEQLRLVENDAEGLLGKVSPYVRVENHEEDSQPMKLSLTSRAVRDLQPRRGFDDSSFVGPSVKNYARLTIETGEGIQAGGLFEKDAGERFGDGFASAYAAVRDWLFLSQAVVGDYILEAGQGLVLWRSSAFGKGSETISIVKKTGLIAQPYRSADEFNFMRGAAATSNIPIGDNVLSVSGFFSRRALSASTTDERVTSFYEEGLFRTANELLKKSNVHEQIVGGRLLYRSNEDWHVGGTLYRSKFDKPVVANQLFDFSGSSATIIGIDAEVNLGLMLPSLSQVTIFAEGAQSNNEARAAIVGSLLNLSHGTSIALLYRNYSPRFTSLHGTGFGERSDTKNERGFYVGVDMRLSRWLHVAGYLDHFRFPWRTFDNPLPTSGRDLLLQADAAFARTLDLSLRYSNKKTETIESSYDGLSRNTRLLIDRLQQKIRLTVAFRASKSLKLKGRMEATHVSYSLVNRQQRGYLFYQEMQYAIPPVFTGEIRLVFFDTDSYDSRLYEYENDVRGVFSNPALYGEGRRWYVLVRWKPTDILSLSAKYSETQYVDRTTIGSGLTEIRGSMDNRLTLQLDLNL
jgi:DNA uptake protein ComE-like DNA-binding protein